MRIVFQRNLLLLGVFILVAILSQPNDSHAQSASLQPTIPVPGDDGICPPCVRPDELNLYRALVEVTQDTVTIITRRNTRNSSGPRIALSINVKGKGCQWVSKAAAQMRAIAKLLAESPVAADLPHLQYWISKLTASDELDTEVSPSARIIRMADIIKAAGAQQPDITLLALGRIIDRGGASIERCLPRMLAGVDGESWEQMYGAPDPRKDIEQQFAPTFACMSQVQSQAERLACLKLVPRK
jgi:hypothetical protein